MIGPFTPSRQRDGTTWVSYHNYRGWYRETKGKRAIGMGKFMGNVAGAKSYAWWNRQDPKPFLGAGVFAARRVAGSLLRKLGMR